jgi:outer membrane protein OmpA-like peptidoglycan-associated protein
MKGQGWGIPRTARGVMGALIGAPWLAAAAQGPMTVTPRSARLTDSVISADLARFDDEAARATLRNARAALYVQLAREAYEKNDDGAISTQLLAVANGASYSRSGRERWWALLDSAYARGPVDAEQRASLVAFENALVRAQHPILGMPSCAAWERQAVAMAPALRVAPAPPPPPPAVETPRAEIAAAPTARPAAPATLRGVPSRVHFALDRAELSPRSQQVLNALADSLAAFPAVRVSLEGHTDRRASAAYNEALSRRRAQSVQQYLIGRGVAASRISTAARGKGKLEQASTDAIGHARNRRVMFRFLAPDGREIPAVDQLDDLQLEKRR